MRINKIYYPKMILSKILNEVASHFECYEFSKFINFLDFMIMRNILRIKCKKY